MIRFNGASDAGELVFAPWSLSESFYILYFDTRRNSIREVLFKGTVGDEFICHYGLDRYRRYTRHVCYPKSHGDSRVFVKQRLHCSMLF